MSNSRSNKEQNQKIELTPNQQNAYLCRPEDWEVEKPNAPAGIEVPGHGQRGENAREEKQLLAERKPTGKGVPLPLEPSEAKKPHTK
jgi:hypothetical protein